MSKTTKCSGLFSTTKSLPLHKLCFPDWRGPLCQPGKLEELISGSLECLLALAVYMISCDILYISCTYLVYILWVVVIFSLILFKVCLVRATGAFGLQSEDQKLHLYATYWSAACLPAMRLSGKHVYRRRRPAILKSLTVPFPHAMLLRLKKRSKGYHRYPQASVFYCHIMNLPSRWQNAQRSRVIVGAHPTISHIEGL